MSSLKWFFLAVWDESKTLISLGLIKVRGQNHGRANRNHSANHSEQKRAQSFVFPPVNIPQSPTHQGGESTSNKHSEREIPYLLKFAVAIAAVLGIPALLIQSCANWRQAGAAERQLKEMAREHMFSERAWINVESITNIPEERPGYFQTVFFNKNNGKTPARHVHEAIGFTMNTNHIPRMDSADIVTSQEVVAPGEIGESKIDIGYVWQMMAVKGERGYFFGTIWYDDIFGKHHWTQYCYIVGPDIPGFKAAPFHNGTDDSEDKNRNSD